MTGRKGNRVLFRREFQFVLGNMEVEGKQNSLFPTGPVISVSLYTSHFKNRKKNANKSFAKHKLAQEFHEVSRSTT